MFLSKVILCVTLLLNGLSLIRLENNNNAINNNNNPIVKYIQQNISIDIKNKLRALKAFHNIILVLNVAVVFLILIGYIVI